MLYIIHKKAYQEFLIYARKLKIYIQNAEYINNKLDRESDFKNLNRVFTAKISVLSDECLDDRIVSKWRSLNAEIQREFRLLNTDLLFLSSSRKTNTREKKLQDIENRIDRLINYSERILELS